MFDFDQNPQPVVNKSRELSFIAAASGADFATAQAALAERWRAIEARLLNKALEKGRGALAID